jgi:hypothetical protein
MKTYVHLWQYLPEFIIEWEMFQTNLTRKNTYFVYTNFFFRKSCHLWDNVEKHDTAGLSINDIIRPMLIACWKTNAKHTHSEWVIHYFSTANMVRRPRPNISFIRTLPNLFSVRTDLLQPSPPLHFRTFKVFLICFPHC